MDRPFWKTIARDVLGLAGLCAIVLFLNLGAAELWDRDEPRNAGCASEMLARGDWVVPVFNDQLRHQKPVLLYWLIMSAYALFGENEFAARFWSAVLGSGTVLLTYGMGHIMVSRSVGLWGALILCTTLMFGVASRAATPDSALIFFMVAALFVFVASNRESWLGLRPLAFPQSFPVVLLFFSLLGLAVLTKGLAGFVLPMAIIGLSLLIARLPPAVNEGAPPPRGWHRVARLTAVRIWNPRHFFQTLWTMKPWWGVIALVAIAGPWYGAVGWRTDGEFLRKFFLDEHIGRATQSFENHSGGLWYYPLAILLGFFPWSIMTWPVVYELFAGRRQAGAQALGFWGGWVLVQVGIFSLVATKLPSYVTPCYPALALMVALAIDRYARGVQQIDAKWFRWGLVALGFVAVPIGGGLAWAGKEYLSGEWKLACLAIPLLAGSLLGWHWSTVRPAWGMGALAGAAILFCALLWGWGTVVVDGTRKTQAFFDQIRAQGPESRIAAYRCLESTWVVYGTHPILELSPGPKQRAESLTRDRNWKPWPVVSPETFVAEVRQPAIITTNEHLEELRGRLPSDFEVLASAQYFLRDKTLVLVGRRLPPARQAVNAETAGAPSSYE